MRQILILQKEILISKKIINFEFILTNLIFNQKTLFVKKGTRSNLKENKVEKFDEGIWKIKVKN